MAKQLTILNDDRRAGPRCPGCRERDRLLEERDRLLEERDRTIAELQARCKRLEKDKQQLSERGLRNSSNSSIPPSANPPEAPKPAPKKRTGRKRGAQRGHAHHPRQLVPSDDVDEIVPIVPPACEKCAAALRAEAAPNDPPPLRYQYVELRDKPLLTTEIQAHARTCGACGHVTAARIPALMRASCVGPRLTAFIAYLSGAHQLSKRAVAEVVDHLGAHLATGTIVRLQNEMSQALAAPHADVGQAVADARAKNVDETGWKEAGQRRWLWTATTQLLAYFVIHSCRGLAGLAALLGTTITGIITSDRWSAYRRLGTKFRQLCWSHLQRDFQQCIDRGGRHSIKLGKGGLAVANSLFRLWHAFRGGTIDRPTLQRRMHRHVRKLRKLLEAGRACADHKLATFCDNLLQLEPALWTFVAEEDVEPTNNHAERILRRGVLWRKRSFGCFSDNGCRFVERMLTAVQTLRLQKRNVYTYLCAAISAFRDGQPVPSLLPENDQPHRHSA